MIARVLSGLTLAAAVGMATPGMVREPAAVSFAGDAARHAPMPLATLGAEDIALHDAVEMAVRDHVPGIAGNDWTLHRLDQTDPDAGGVRRVVAEGVVTPAGGPGTDVRLTGRFDPASGGLTQVAYRLQPPAAARAASGDGHARAWSIQASVQQALDEALPGEDVRFALDSAQATRLPDGERRFDGFGIGTWGKGEARFVAFSLVLSKEGRPVAFDYGTEGGDDEPTMIARR